MSEEEKTDENKIDWGKRFTDPSMMDRWKASIRVEPANRDRGIFVGWRTFPDGTREPFTVQ